MSAPPPDAFTTPTREAHALAALTAAAAVKGGLRPWQDGYPRAEEVIELIADLFAYCDQFRPPLGVETLPNPVAMTVLALDVHAQVTNQARTALSDGLFEAPADPEVRADPSNTDFGAPFTAIALYEFPVTMSATAHVWARTPERAAHMLRQVTDIDVVDTLGAGVVFEDACLTLPAPASTGTDETPQP